MIRWRKSSFSDDTGNCVEVAETGPIVLVRNSTRPGAGTLSLSRSAVAAFVAASASGELDDLA